MVADFVIFSIQCRSASQPLWTSNPQYKPSNKILFWNFQTFFFLMFSMTLHYSVKFFGVDGRYSARSIKRSQFFYMEINAEVRFVYAV